MSDELPAALLEKVQSMAVDVFLGFQRKRLIETSQQIVEREQANLSVSVPNLESAREAKQLRTDNATYLEMAKFLMDVKTGIIKWEPASNIESTSDPTKKSDHEFNNSATFQGTRG